jgi:hypothetical protein
MITARPQLFAVARFKAVIEPEATRNAGHLAARPIVSVNLRSA